MSTNPKLDSDIFQMYDDLIKNQKLTPVAVQRALILYQDMVRIMDKYKPLLADPTNGLKYALQMDKEIIGLLGKEIDMNFYEGMMDAATKTLMSVMKIPQVKELSKQFALEVAGKSPNGAQLEDLIKKAFGGTTEKTGTTETGTKDSTMDSILDTLGVPRKDRLN